MATQLERQHYIREAYLSLEESAEVKHEYCNGEIRPMTGRTDNHNQLVGSIYAYLKLALRGQSYRFYINDMRLWIPRYQLYTYPDVMVVAGEPMYERASHTTIMNPAIIVEVLSKSTHTYDKTDKFRFYRSIPEFQEYILIDQYEFYVEQFSNTGNGNWLFRDYETADAVLQLTTIAVQVPLRDLYESVDFDLKDTEA